MGGIIFWEELVFAGNSEFEESFDWCLKVWVYQVVQLDKHVTGVVEETEGVVFEQFTVPSSMDLFSSGVEVFENLWVEKRLKGCSDGVGLCDEGGKVTKGGNGEECSCGKGEEGSEE